MIEYLEGEKTLRQKTAVAESKGRSSEKGSEPDREGGPDEKKEKAKEKYDGTEPMR